MSDRKKAAAQAKTVTVYCDSFSVRTKTGPFKVDDTGWMPDENTGRREFFLFNGSEWLRAKHSFDPAF